MSGFPLFVYHCPLEVAEPTVVQLFSAHGHVTHCKIMRDATSGRSKGYCFVGMKTLQEADAAIKGLNGFQIAGKFLKVAHKK